MSAEHESSYYEIALTNRQVLTIFVVLLTCLVAAFLSGVWLGRRDAPEAPVAVADGGPAADDGAAQLTELNFFSEGSREGEPRVETPPPPRPSPPPATAAPTEPMPAPAEEAQPPPAEGPSSPAVTAGRVIQVFSTRDASQADSLVRRLGAGGYPAFLVEESLADGKTYRVRVGPYREEARARQVAEELRREYRLDTWITSQPG